MGHRANVKWAIVAAALLGVISSHPASAAVFVVAGSKGGGPAPAAFDTLIPVSTGQILTVCAEEKVSLVPAGPFFPPDGDFATTPGTFWEPSAPPGALVGIIGGITFPLGRCYHGTVPANGNLELGVNDNTSPSSYGDNVGAFRVFVGVTGSPQKVTTYTIAGASTNIAWEIGFEDSSLGTFASADRVVHGPIGTGPAVDFIQPFVDDINVIPAASGDRCRCALKGNPGFGTQGSSIDYIDFSALCTAAGVPLPCCLTGPGAGAGGANCLAVGMCDPVPAGSTCTSAVIGATPCCTGLSTGDGMGICAPTGTCVSTPPGPEEDFTVISELTTASPGLNLWVKTPSGTGAPDCNVDAQTFGVFPKCTFNPTILVAGSDEPPVPALSVRAMVVFLLLGAGAILVIRRRRRRTMSR